MNPHYSLVARRAAYRCEYCHAPESFFNLSFEVDHIVPSSRGGTDADSNLALACRACNLYKSDYLTGLDTAAQRTVALFHPRQHRWEAHFVFNPQTWLLEGTTPEGRATIARLQINRAPQITARQLWILHDLFP